MKEQKKQNLLTAIIVILVIILAILVGSIVYEEIINMNKAQSLNTSVPTIKEEEPKDDTIKEEENTEDEEQTELEEENKVEEQAPTAEDNKEQEYVGKEESNSQEETTENKDEKAIQLVKNEWGKDNTVTFSIEKKNGSKYRVAVRDNSTSVLAWYEVDTETWEVSEY